MSHIPAHVCFHTHVKKEREGMVGVLRGQERGGLVNRVLTLQA